MKKIVLLLILALLVTGCTQTQTQVDENKLPADEQKATPVPEEIELVVKQGDTVKVDYTGTLEDGTVFDSSDGKAPLEFKAGTGQMIKGFDAAIIGMKEGEEKDITLKPEEAYGAFNPELIKEIPREQLPPGQEPQVGMILVVSTVEGAQIPAKISEVDENTIKVNLNHELAGKTLKFHVKIVEITPAN